MMGGRIWCVPISSHMYVHLSVHACVHAVGRLSSQPVSLLGIDRINKSYCIASCVLYVCMYASCLSM